MNHSSASWHKLPFIHPYPLGFPAVLCPDDEADVEAWDEQATHAAVALSRICWIMDSGDIRPRKCFGFQCIEGNQPGHFFSIDPFLFPILEANRISERISIHQRIPPADGSGHPQGISIDHGDRPGLGRILSI